MKRGLFYLCVCIAALAVGGTGLIVGYRFISPGGKSESIDTADGSETSDKLVDSASFEMSGSDPEYTLPPMPTDDSANAIEQDIIETDTKIIYEYHYQNGKTERRQEEAPYFLLGMTEENITDLYADWEVVHFSPDQVILQKDVGEKDPPHYIVGIQDGYVAVFYQSSMSKSSLEQVTDTPVSALSADERQRLSSGIKIYDDEKLMKVLEDYGS